MRCLSLFFGTVVILSTMSRERVLRPLRSLDAFRCSFPIWMSANLIKRRLIELREHMRSFDRVWYCRGVDHNIGGASSCS